jgi:hypothetical protein
MKQIEKKSKIKNAHNCAADFGYLKAFSSEIYFLHFQLLLARSSFTAPFFDANTAH